MKDSYVFLTFITNTGCFISAGLRDQKVATRPLIPCDIYGIVLDFDKIWSTKRTPVTNGWKFKKMAPQRNLLFQEAPISGEAYV